MNLMIRRAEHSDAPEIAQLQQTTWREAYSGLLPTPILDGLALPRLLRNWHTELMRQDVDLDYGLFVAESEDGKALGYASCGATEGHESRILGDGEIHQIYVRASHQGRGLGRALMLACSRWLVMRGLFNGGLWVVKGNDRARAFYEQIGGHYAGAKRDRMQGWQIPVVAYTWEDLDELAGIDSEVPSWL
jgi:GNAT superfamily N-acetyltransferase